MLLPVVLNEGVVFPVSIQIIPDLLGQFFGIHCRNLILRLAGLRIDRYISRNRADLSAFHHLMAGNDCLGMAHVHDVVDLPLLNFPFLITQALGYTQPFAIYNLHVLLVDGEPVFDAVAEVFKQGAAVEVKFINNASVMPAAELLIDPYRHVIVVNGNDRFDSGSLEFVDQVVVELDALRIDLAVRSRNDS